MRELRKKAVYAYQFIPLRRGRDAGTSQFYGRYPGKDAWFGRFAKAAPAGSSGSSDIERHRARSSGIERHRAASSGIERHRATSSDIESVIRSP
jgi:hypothetical protein